MKEENVTGLNIRREELMTVLVGKQVLSMPVLMT